MPYVKGLSFLLFIVTICLFSGVGFTASVGENNFTVTYESDTEVYHLEPNSVEYNLSEGTCWDLDVILPIITTGETLWFENLTIDCGNSDADIKCVEGGTGSYGHAQANYVTRVSSIDNTNAVTDAVGLEWTRNQDTTRRKAIYTNDGTYVIAWMTGEVTWNTYCVGIDLWVKNQTYNPYLVTNITGVEYDSTYISETMNPLAQIDRVHFFLTDLGYTVDKFLVSSAEWSYYYDNPYISQATQLSTNGGLYHTTYDTVYTTTDDTRYIACDDDIANLQTDTFYEINIPVGTYDIFCHNGSTAHSTDTNYRWFTLKVINNTANNFDVFLGGYTGDHTSISNVYHTPTIPLPNMSVKVYWVTSTSQNQSLYWRAKPIGNWSDNWSSWVVQKDSNTFIQHNFTIDGDDILDGYQYQYYIQSGGTIDNNTDTYYNFTVGGYPGVVNTIPPDLENTTYPVVANATEDLAENLGISQQNALGIFSGFIIALATLGSILASKSLSVGGTVLITAICIFSLMGFLPYYLFIVIAIVFALLFVRFLMGVFGNG